MSLIPLHLDVLERNDGSVYTCIESWWLLELKLVRLSPDGYYARVFD